MAVHTNLSQHPTDEMYKETPLAIFCGFADVSSMLLAKHSQDSFFVKMRETHQRELLELRLIERESIVQISEKDKRLTSTGLIEWYARADNGTQMGFWYPTSNFCNLLGIHDTIATRYPRGRIRHRRAEHINFVDNFDWKSEEFDGRQIAGLIECDSSFMVSHMVRLFAGEKPMESCIASFKIGNESRIKGKFGKTLGLTYVNSIHSRLFVITTKSGNTHSGVLVDVVSGIGDLDEALTQAKKLHPKAKFVNIAELEIHLQTLETTAVAN